MDRIDYLKNIFVDSGLSEIFDINKTKDVKEKNYSTLRVKSNYYRIRAFEIWEHKDGQFFRIYHSQEIPIEIKKEISSIDEQFRSPKNYVDFRGDFLEISKNICEILSSEDIINVAEQNPIMTTNSKYEGLTLPDIDVSDTDILGREFTWREIIAISEDQSDENDIKNVLSQNGVYLQRSKDGKSRYVGSAYGSGGILARWLKHLDSNGDAKHLNLFVLENGYNNIIFTILEITDHDSALQSEQRWKRTLGSKNNGAYDGIRLNNN